MWKRRARKKDGGTKRETARPQGPVLSFYGHVKLRRRRTDAASGAAAAVGSRGQSEGGEAVWKKGEGCCC